MKRKFPKIIYFLVSFLLIFEQSGFAQVAGELNIAGHLNAMRSAFVQDKFHPVHLRYISYDNINNNFKLLLDKGDNAATNPQAETKTLLKYFFIGISLPNDTFWVNLRPDSPENIIDPALAQTDLGKILLEADLQLKQDTARFTSPETPAGKEYWNKLYQKAGELFGTENITIPTLTRPWIVPDEIIIREAANRGLSPQGTVPDSPSAYIYKATLKVMLEQDYLKNSSTYNFSDPRLKQLNEYSSQLIREKILPKLVKEVNTAKRYAPLRQVYYSLILAQWFKKKFYGQGGLYSWLIDKKNLTGLTSQDTWTKDSYFQAYQKSFKEGEYNIKEQVYSLGAQTIRTYMSGGINLLASSAIQNNMVTSSRKMGWVTLLTAGLLGLSVATSDAAGLNLKMDNPYRVSVVETTAQAVVQAEGPTTITSAKVEAAVKTAPVLKEIRSDDIDKLVKNNEINDLLTILKGPQVGIKTQVLDSLNKSNNIPLLKRIFSEINVNEDLLIHNNTPLGLSTVACLGELANYDIRPINSLLEIVLSKYGPEVRYQAFLMMRAVGTPQLKPKVDQIIDSNIDALIAILKERGENNKYLGLLQADIVAYLRAMAKLNLLESLIISPEIPEYVRRIIVERLALTNLGATLKKLKAYTEDKNIPAWIREQLIPSSLDPDLASKNSYLPPRYTEESNNGGKKLTEEQKRSIQDVSDSLWGIFNNDKLEDSLRKKAIFKLMDIRFEIARGLLKSHIDIIVSVAKDAGRDISLRDAAVRALIIINALDSLRELEPVLNNLATEEAVGTNMKLVLDWLKSEKDFRELKFKAPQEGQQFPEDDAAVKKIAEHALSYLRGSWLLEERQWQSILSRIIFDTKFRSSLNDAWSDFDIGVGLAVNLEKMVKEDIAVALGAIMAHEETHEILKLMGLRDDNFELASIHEFIADLGMLAYLQASGKEDLIKIMLEFLGYEKAAEAVREDKTGEKTKEHQVVRARLYGIIADAEKNGIKINWVKIFEESQKVLNKLKGRDNLKLENVIKGLKISMPTSAASSPAAASSAVRTKQESISASSSTQASILDKDFWGYIVIGTGLAIPFFLGSFIVMDTMLLLGKANSGNPVAIQKLYSRSIHGDFLAKGVLKATKIGKFPSASLNNKEILLNLIKAGNTAAINRYLSKAGPSEVLTCIAIAEQSKDADAANAIKNSLKDLDISYLIELFDLARVETHKFLILELLFSLSSEYGNRSALNVITVDREIKNYILNHIIGNTSLGVQYLKAIAPSVRDILKRYEENRRSLYIGEAQRIDFVIHMAMNQRINFLNLVTGNSDEVNREVIDLFEKAKNFGIDFPFRLDVDILKEIIKNRTLSKSDGRPLAVVIFPKSDWNQGFYYSSEHIRKLIEHGYRVMFYEAGTDKAAIEAVKDATNEELAGILIFGGHGRRESLRLGEGRNQDHFLDLSDNRILEEIRPALRQNGQVILDSCSTGEGTAAGNNMANMTRKIFPQALPQGIYAPTIPNSIKEIIFDKDNRVINVIYDDKSSPGYRAALDSANKTEVALGDNLSLPYSSSAIQQNTPAAASSAVKNETGAVVKKWVYRIGTAAVLVLPVSIVVGTIVTIMSLLSLAEPNTNRSTEVKPAVHLQGGVAETLEARIGQALEAVKERLFGGQEHKEVNQQAGADRLEGVVSAEEIQALLEQAQSGDWQALDRLLTYAKSEDPRNDAARAAARAFNIAYYAGLDRKDGPPPINNRLLDGRGIYDPDRNGFRAISDLAAEGNREAREYLRYKDITPSKTQINRAHGEYTENWDVLVSCALNGGNISALNAIVDLTHSSREDDRIRAIIRLEQIAASGLGTDQDADQKGVSQLAIKVLEEKFGLFYNTEKKMFSTRSFDNWERGWEEERKMRERGRNPELQSKIDLEPPATLSSIDSSSAASSAVSLKKAAAIGVTGALLLSSPGVYPQDSFKSAGEEKIQRLTESAAKDDNGAILDLISLARRGDQLALKALDMLASSNYMVNLELSDLAKHGNTIAEEVVQNSIPKIIIEKATQGNYEAVVRLVDLASRGNPTAKKAVKTLDIANLIRIVSQDNTDAFWAIKALSLLACKGNTQALNELIGLVSQGKGGIFWSLREVFNSITLELRVAHLEERVPNSVLEKELTKKTFNDNPFVLYACYVSQENFSDLAKMILQRLKSQAKSRGKSLDSFLKELDPNKALYKDFVLQMANFNQLGSLISSPEALYATMDDLFKATSEDSLKSYSVRLALFTENIINDKNFIYQKEFQEYLRRLYDQTSGLNRRFIAALLIVYQYKLKYLSRSDITNITKTEGIKEKNILVDYDKLFKYSKLTAHIVFADNDAVTGHFLPTLQLFQGKNRAYPNIGGYKLISATENQAVLEKGKIRLVLIKANAEGYDIDKHLGDVGIIISRSHAGAEQKVFKAQLNPVVSPGKIFLISACRSATVIGSLAQIYPKAEFIGVNSTAEGMKTNIFTYYLLKALEKHIRSYAEIKDFIKVHFREGVNDYVLPGDPALIVYRILISGSSPVSASSAVDEKFSTRREFLIKAALAGAGAAATLSPGLAQALELAARPKAKTPQKVTKQPAAKPAVIEPATPKAYVLTQIPKDDKFVASLREQLWQKTGTDFSSSLKGYIELSNTRVDLLNGVYAFLGKSGISFKQGYNVLFVSEAQIEGQAVVLTVNGQNLIVLDLNQFIDQIKKGFQDWDPLKRAILEVSIAEASAKLDSRQMPALKQERAANEAKLQAMQALKMSEDYRRDPAWYQAKITHAYRAIDNGGDFFNKRSVTQDELNQAQLSDLAVNNNNVIKAILRVRGLDVLVFIFPDGGIEIPSNKDAAESATKDWDKIPVNVFGSLSHKPMRNLAASSAVSIGAKEYKPYVDPAKFEYKAIGSITSGGARLDMRAAWDGRETLSVVFENQDKEMAGFIDVRKNITGRSISFTLNYIYLNKQFRGNGYSRDMTVAIVNRLKDGTLVKPQDAGLIKIYINVYPQNPLAVETCKDLGFIEVADPVAKKIATTVIVYPQDADRITRVYVERDSAIDENGYVAKKASIEQAFDASGDVGIVGKPLDRNDGKRVTVFTNYVWYFSDADASPVVEKDTSSGVKDTKGGIDLRALPIASQPIPVGSGIKLNSIPPIPLARLEKEWLEIENMLQAGMMPSSERIKEYLQSCSQKQDYTQDVDKVLSCVADILRMEEDRVVPTEPGLKGLLILLESNSSSSNMQLALAKITIDAKEPMALKQ